MDPLMFFWIILCIALGGLLFCLPYYIEFRSHTRLFEYLKNQDSNKVEQELANAFAELEELRERNTKQFSTQKSSMTLIEDSIRDLQNDLKKIEQSMLTQSKKQDASFQKNLQKLKDAFNELSKQTVAVSQDTPAPQAQISLPTSVTEEIAESTPEPPPTVIPPPIKEPKPTPPQVTPEEVPKAQQIELIAAEEIEVKTKIEEPSKEKNKANPKKGSPSNVTTLHADVMIGIGNKPYLRGNGAGLSFAKGVPMDFLEIGKWQWTTKSLKKTLTCKIYKNDQIPATGDTFTIKPGQTLQINPSFPEEIE